MKASQAAGTLDFAQQQSFTSAMAKLLLDGLYAQRKVLQVDESQLA